MNKLINRKVLISMIFIGLTMMGLFSYRYLLMELYPDAEFPSLNVTISTKTELDPKYIESQAAIPVEGVISGLEGVEDITTLISNRNARITVSFTKNTNVKYAYLKLEEKIKAITKSIPEDFTIQVNKAGSGMASDQFMTLQILGDDDVDYVRNITDIDIAPILESTDGIASVTVMGGRQKSIEILLDDEKCKALNITASQVSSLIGKNMSEKTFAGSVFQDNKRFFVNVTAEYLATEDLGNIVVSEGPVLLKDIADINFGIKEEESYSRVNGKEVITCVISKSPLVNIIDLSQRVREEIAQLNEELATKGVSIKVDTDTAETMSENINTIINLGLTGTEIKSIRQGKASLVDTFCFFSRGELWVKNMHIAEYFYGSYNNHSARRDRKLLLTKKELRKLERTSAEPGFTIVPTRLYINEKGLAKVVIALAKGKKQYDKRQTLKEKEDKRMMDRMFKR